MKILVDIDKFLDKEKLDEAPTLTRQHYTWFLDVFSEACKVNNIRKPIYLKLINTLLDDFAKTNTNFKPAVFLNYAKKLYNAEEEE